MVEAGGTEGAMGGVGDNTRPSSNMIISLAESGGVGVIARLASAALLLLCILVEAVYEAGGVKDDDDSLRACLRRPRALSAG